MAESAIAARQNQGEVSESSVIADLASPAVSVGANSLTWTVTVRTVHCCCLCVPEI